MDCWLSEGERHRRRRILQINDGAMLIQEGIPLFRSAVDTQGHPHYMSELAWRGAIRIDFKHTRQLARSVERIQQATDDGRRKRSLLRQREEQPQMPTASAAFHEARQAMRRECLLCV